MKNLEHSLQKELLCSGLIYVLSGCSNSHNTPYQNLHDSDTQSEELELFSPAKLYLDVIDAGNGTAIDTTQCDINVILTSSSGYTETVPITMEGIAEFTLYRGGTYGISVPSTNTGSTCYGGFVQEEWVDIVEGDNFGWVTLIPESYQNEVIKIVGENHINMAGVRGHKEGSVDNVTKLTKYMSEIMVSFPMLASWDKSIREGTVSLTVDTIDYTSGGLQYNDAVIAAIDQWNGSLAPSIQQVSSGGDIWFTFNNEWPWVSDKNYESVTSTGVRTLSDCEIKYGNNGITMESVTTTFGHQLGHCLFGSDDTNVPEFIMHTFYINAVPQELEKLVARILNNIGNENPRGYPIDIFNGYLEE